MSKKEKKKNGAHDVNMERFTTVPFATARHARYDGEKTALKCVACGCLWQPVALESRGECYCGDPA